MAARFHQCNEPALAERQTRLNIEQSTAREALLRLGDEQGFHWHPDSELTIHLYSPHSTPPPPVEVWTHQLPVPLHGGAEESLAAFILDRWPSPHLGSSIVASPGQWIVTQPYDVQLRTQQFLRQLDAHLTDVSKIESQGLRSDDPRVAPRRFNSQPEAELAIQAALNRRMSLDVKREKLVDVIGKVAAAGGITIVLTNKIEDVGMHPDYPVTFQASNLRVGTILNYLLSENRNLTYIVKGTALHITSFEDAMSPQHQVLVAYPIADLKGSIGAPNDELARLIRGIQWDETLNTGRTYFFRDLLLVSNREQVHQQLTRLLRVLRSVRNREQRSANIQLSSPERARTLSLLLQPCAFKYSGLKFKDVIADLEQRTGVSIFQSNKMEDAGINEDHRICCDFPARPLAENLWHMLDEINLTMIVDEEMVIVTTIEEAASPERVETEIIDVRPLSEHWRARELANLVPLVIKRNDWSIGTDCLEFGGLLVIRQRREVLEQIHHLLAVLERHARSPAPRTDRGNLLAKLPLDFRGTNFLFDVHDLLKPVGKFTPDELLTALSEGPAKLQGEPSEGESLDKLTIHSQGFISAYLKLHELEILEERLKHLRSNPAP